MHSLIQTYTYCDTYDQISHNLFRNNLPGKCELIVVSSAATSAGMSMNRNII